MAEVVYSEELARTLAGRVIVVAGGAQGIGGATVTLLHSHGAHVFFGDINTEKGTELESKLATTDIKIGPSPVFKRVDVANHDDLLDLFEAAFQVDGRVDAAIFCAAVREPPGLFDARTLTRDSLLAAKGEESRVAPAIDINLTSVIHFSRIALGYFNSSKRSADDVFTPSITLVSSIAGITPAPGLFAYSSAKHGIIGLTRSLALYTPTSFPPTRVNAICPWATDTQLLAKPVREAWIAQAMPLNSPTDVARQIVQCTTDGSLNGTTVYVAGGRGYDTEVGVESTRKIWMGAENCEVWERGQEILGLGGDWTTR